VLDRNRPTTTVRSVAVERPPSRGGCTGQKERRRGSPRRSGGGGVAGSGRRDDIPVEGISGGVATSSGAVLRLEAEARKGIACVASGQRRKGSRGKSSDVWRGSRRGGAPTGGGQLGRRGTTGSGPAAALACGARVRTLVGGAGSLTSGARMAVGGHGEREARARVGRPGKEMEWAEPV
jgi:hypothetical protein